MKYPESCSALAFLQWRLQARAALWGSFPCTLRKKLAVLIPARIKLPLELVVLDRLLLKLIDYVGTFSKVFNDLPVKQERTHRHYSYRYVIDDSR